VGARRTVAKSAAEGRPRQRQPIRILIADDFPFLRYGLRLFLDDLDDMSVIGEATTTDELLALMAGRQADVLLLDGDLPGLSHADLLSELRSRFPEARVIVLIPPEDLATVAISITKGAAGCVLKTAEPTLLVKAIRSVNNGEPWLQREMTSRVFSQIAEFNDALQERGKAPLTRREREVLSLVAEGLRNAQIAERLFVTERTVKAHVTNLLRKLGLKGRVEAVRYAIRNQLTSL
jgi:DNA-binding NarL/FixJ family response regulator